MRTARNQKRIALYAVCACFFCLAGVFQAVDSRLPEFWHALFALSAHTILLSLVVAWGVSLIHRMVRGGSARVLSCHMLGKTGFRSRTQLAVRARESGLVILDRNGDEL